MKNNGGKSGACQNGPITASPFKLVVLLIWSLVIALLGSTVKFWSSSFSAKRFGEGESSEKQSDVCQTAAPVRGA